MNFQGWGIWQVVVFIVVVVVLVWAATRIIPMFT
jgi:hypothetical protein